MQSEYWKPIEFNLFYEVSNLGRVRSVDRTIIRSDGKIKKFVGRNLKPQKWSNGYLKVSLHDHCNKMESSIHRLVAIHFIPNPENKATVNHKDGNKENNTVENLEWATQSENNYHSFATGLKIGNSYYKGKFGYEHNRSKEVLVYSMITNELIGRYGSSTQCAKAFNVSPSTVNNGCNGKFFSYMDMVYMFSL